MKLGDIVHSIHQLDPSLLILSCDTNYSVPYILVYNSVYKITQDLWLDIKDSNLFFI